MTRIMFICEGSYGMARLVWADDLGGVVSVCGACRRRWSDRPKVLPLHERYEVEKTEAQG